MKRGLARKDFATAIPTPREVPTTSTAAVGAPRFGFGFVCGRAPRFRSLCCSAPVAFARGAGLKAARGGPNFASHAASTPPVCAERGDAEPPVTSRPRPLVTSPPCPLQGKPCAWHRSPPHATDRTVLRSSA
eukprot:3950120-Prymnesium_polylepis.1